MSVEIWYTIQFAWYVVTEFVIIVFTENIFFIDSIKTNIETNQDKK